MTRPLPPALTREALLVVFCARGHVDEVTASRIHDMVQGGVDWERVAALAKWHGVVPHVYRNLNRHGAGQVTPAVLEDLKQYYQANALLGHSLIKDLAALCEACDREGVTIVPFKGLTLALTAYGDLAGRECGDLDFIVRREDLGRVRELLMREGYEDAVDRHVAASDGAAAFHIFIKRSRSVTVDLQWVMADGTFHFPLDEPRFWSRLNVIAAAGKPIKVLSPEDTLLVLCVHGAKHVFEHLKWVCDIAELIQAHPSLDWTYVEKTARELGCRRMVLVGLGLAQALFQVRVPSCLIEAVHSDRTIMGLTRRMPQSLLADSAYGLGEADSEAFVFAMKDSVWGRIRHGLLLCQNRSQSLGSEYPWLPSWKLIRVGQAALEPFRRTIGWIVLSVGVKRWVAKWLSPCRVMSLKRGADC